MVDDASPVPRGQIEIEFGLLFAQPNNGGRDHRLPSMTLSYGVLTNLEFGLALQRVAADTKGEKPIEGFEDLHLKAKYQLLEEASRHPAISFALDLNVPTANRRKGLSTGRTDANFLLIGSKTLDKVGADLNLAYLLVKRPPGDNSANRIFGGIAARWSVDDRWMVVGEVFGLSRETERETNEANFQLGLRYQWSPDLTLDGGIGRSLRSVGTQFQTTFGLTWTFYPSPP